MNRGGRRGGGSWRHPKRTGKSYSDRVRHFQVRDVRPSDFQKVREPVEGGADMADCPLAQAYPRRLLTAARRPRCRVEPFGPTIAAPRRPGPV